MLDTISHATPTFMFSGLGFGLAAVTAHYGTGQVVDGVISLAKKRFISVVSGIAINSLAVWLQSVSIEEVLFYSGYALACGGAGFLAGSVSMYGTGRVMTSIKAIVKHPLAAGLTGFNVGMIAGCAAGINVGVMICEPDAFSSSHRFAYPLRSRMTKYLTCSGIFGNLAYFTGKAVIKCGSGQVAGLSSFIKSSYGAGIAGFLVGEIVGLSLGIVWSITVYQTLDFLMDVEYDPKKEHWVSIWD